MAYENTGKPNRVEVPPVIILLANTLKMSALPFSRGHWRNLESNLPKVDRAFNKVRWELEELGLLDDGVLLDQV
jgi:hypothetical protein